ncbi:hypothetical protein CKO15_13685 [Halorhodospira abdelmalekii]|uniref:UvrD-helicase domain-containing protein n=1 Tax=Halorhodospira abdelmalekii TaxID=421629 RepID=UPI001903A246|nr:UvrD-helicase domain-containing protein [Halorhodospira abdelmalekii]MBK1736291.1 hypothetical protein [Halorhodospira abdelmalekii]
MTEEAKTLQAEAMPLHGIHLIEASAGTGKTFNITRLYLRLLLERELSVQHILVMTFTRAATAELKGRLSAEIERAYSEWERLDEPFYECLRARLPDAVKVRALLRNAQLHMDEAAIYTIHGFCRRALTQEAFLSGISFQAEMEAETHGLVVEALEDWYREVAKQPDFAQLYGYLATPEQFAERWSRTILSHETLPAEPEVPAFDTEWQAFCNAWAADQEDGEAAHFIKLNVKSRRNPEKAAQWQAIYEELTTLSTQPAPSDPPELLEDPALLKDGFNTEKKLAALPALAALVERLAERRSALHAWWAWRGIAYC